MYNTCTIFVRLPIVQVLYNYCTYIVQRPELVRSCNGDLAVKKRRWSGLFTGAVRADAFDDIFGLFGNEAFGQGYGRYGDVGEAECPVAACAGEVHVALAMARVVVVADAVFLHAAAIVDAVQQVGVAEEGQRTEQGGTVDGGQRLFEVAEAEHSVGVVAHLAPYHCAYGCYADTCIG